jgi:hypothetical protein
MDISELAKIDGYAEKLIYMLIKFGHITPVSLCKVAGIERKYLMQVLKQLVCKRIILKQGYGIYSAVNCQPEQTLPATNCMPEHTLQSATPENKDKKRLSFVQMFENEKKKHAGKPTPAKIGEILNENPKQNKNHSLYSIEGLLKKYQDIYRKAKKLCPDKNQAYIPIMVVLLTRDGLLKDDQWVKIHRWSKKGRCPGACLQVNLEDELGVENVERYREMAKVHQEAIYMKYSSPKFTAAVNHVVLPPENLIDGLNHFQKPNQSIIKQPP